MHVDQGTALKLFRRFRWGKALFQMILVAVHSGTVPASFLEFLFLSCFYWLLLLRMAPCLWKPSIIVLLPKQASSRPPNNYRPVALTSFFIKKHLSRLLKMCCRILFQLPVFFYWDPLMVCSLPSFFSLYILMNVKANIMGIILILIADSSLTSR